MLCFVLFLPLVWATAQTDPTCDGNGAKGTSLLSLKADAVKALDTRAIFADMVSTFSDNVSATNNTNASWQRVNQSLHQSVEDLAPCLQRPSLRSDFFVTNDKQIDQFSCCFEIVNSASALHCSCFEVTNVMVADANQTGTVPNPEGGFTRYPIKITIFTDHTTIVWP